MKKPFTPALTLLLIMPLLFSCNSEMQPEQPAGKLYIIGGGSRPESMLNEIVDISGLRNGGWMYVLPMASEEADRAIIWTREGFSVTGITAVYGHNFRPGAEIPEGKIDSIINARCIYIPGGVQGRFMEAVRNTPVADAIHEAYKRGAVIAGTSAGAAVMSRLMITGDQLKPQSSREGYTTIQPENIELAEGLGLLSDVIVDQHFIKRQRLNRLVAVAIENPGQLCAGIDESTAIIIEGNKATVTGLSQVIVIKNRKGTFTADNDLLGATGLELSVYTPGSSFMLR